MDDKYLNSKLSRKTLGFVLLTTMPPHSSAFWPSQLIVSLATDTLFSAAIADVQKRALLHHVVP